MDNILGLAASVIWEINPRFSILAEFLGTDEEPPEFKEEHPYFFQGAVNYHPNERMTVGVYAGAGKNSPRDVFTSLRIAYDL